MSLISSRLYMFPKMEPRGTFKVQFLSVFFCFFFQHLWTFTLFRSIKTHKKDLVNYPPHLTLQAWLINHMKYDLTSFPPFPPIFAKWPSFHWTIIALSMGAVCTYLLAQRWTGIFQFCQKYATFGEFLKQRGKRTKITDLIIYMEKLLSSDWLR